eukprot:Seg1898.1 transcript_id=Seg1898.1/GoldUCD/mRNA.D3Y31 product="hypothetical protein" protein_id=Seg1898.1/GoldUCD/D3Y31
MDILEIYKEKVKNSGNKYHTSFIAVSSCILSLIIPTLDLSFNNWKSVIFNRCKMKHLLQVLWMGIIFFFIHLKTTTVYKNNKAN